MVQFHFISGLPRSGSTLLAGILRQNTTFHAAMSSPVASLMNSILEQTGAGSEFFTFFDNDRRKAIIKAVFDAYYKQERQEKQVIFDTSRAWTSRLHQLTELYSDFKVICLVRNPAWIADSFECIYRKNPFEYSRMYSGQTRQTVYSRCESLMSASGTIGSAWSALKEAYYGEHSDKLLLLDYDLLASYPEKCLNLLYQFLQLKPFSHDFENVEYQEEEFDAKLGARGLHLVKRKVRFKTRRSILPPDLFKKYEEMMFWSDTSGTSANIIGKKSS